MNTADLDLTADQAELASDVLHKMAGPDAALRDDQLTAVAALCRPASRVLVVQATGWGKSAVYWIATAIGREAGRGPTLVISPLLSLMRDQVEAAARAGLTARTLNSSNFEDWAEIEREIGDDAVDVLLVSPERLANPTFGRRVLDRLGGRIGLLVIDEAHSISDWGHDFRPDYRRLSTMLTRLNPEAAVLATTATANARVTDDVAAQLGDTLVLRGPLARSSLQLVVLEEQSPMDRFAWVCERLGELPGSGIVYALTVDQAEALTAAIRAVHGDALPVAAYTGRLDGAERHRLENALRRNEIKALVATSALGMGFDKPDLGFVVHVGAPPSPVSYYQQVGRAGRGIDRAVVVLLPSEADRHVWDYFATATIPVPSQVESVLDALRQEDAPISVPKLEAQTGVRRTRAELILKQLAVDDVVERQPDGWVATGKEWVYDKAHFDSVIATREREATIMREYAAGSRCLMQLLQESLDDPSAAPCGRCSVCDPDATAAWRQPVDPALLASVQQALRGQVATLEPRKMWPGAPSSRKGRISATVAADWGRVLVDYDAPQWAGLVRESLSADMPASDELRTAVTQVLAAWSRGDRRNPAWERRPDVVVDLASGGLPVLTGSLADHIAAVGRMVRARLDPDAVALGARRVRTEDLPSAAQAALWEGSVQLDADSADAVRGAAVLLIADRDPMGWAITVTAAALREAGADVVLPLLLHRTNG
ncbi:DEAD/DEAH box helicase [Cumulibacter manganitolerans]|uniref:DEAD/DEAH box helicase n=1 Tax=Cumulibacter manganitolerans TaxID=1884992 RepID=UPI001E5CDB70|nr:DEAD/DEAH box helicase [Cumulibacter manganitolerans]